MLSVPTRRRSPGRDAPPARRAAVVVLAVLCVVVAGTVGPWQPGRRAASSVSIPLPTVAAEIAAPRERPAQRLELGPADPDLAWIGRAVWLTVITVVLVLLVRWALRRRLPVRTPPPQPLPSGGEPALTTVADAAPDGRALREGAEAAAEHLRGPTSPGDGVIAAWLALEDAAGRSGVRRRPSATPTEFALQVLDRTAADPAAARTLLSLYLRARFDDRPLGVDDLRTAAGAADRLLVTLGTAAAGRGDGVEGRAG